MEGLPVPNDEAEKVYCELYSISAKFTDAKNRYNALYETTRELESPSHKDRITRAASLRAIFIGINNDILQLLERLNALLYPPKYNVFTGEPEQETASENRINPATTDAIPRNDLLDETIYYIRLLDDKIEAELALSPESKINNDTLQSQSEDAQTLPLHTEEIFNLDGIGWRDNSLFVKCLRILSQRKSINNSINAIPEILSLSQKIKLKNNEIAELIGLLDAFGAIGCTLEIKGHPTIKSFVRDIKMIFETGKQGTIENKISDFLNEKNTDDKKIFRKKVNSISLRYQALFENNDE